MSKQRNGLVKKIKARLIHAGPLFTISRWCLETARTAYIRAVRTASNGVAMMHVSVGSS